MECDYCENEATLHLTQVVDGEIRKVHLCETCARDMGVDPEAALSVTDLLLGLGKEPMAPKPVPRKPGNAACPECGMRVAHLKKTGRVGCATCYSTFHAQLAPMIESMQHATQHLGRMASGAPLADQAMVGAATARAALSRAVAVEDYETAASLRDTLGHWEQLLHRDSSPTEEGG